MGKLKEIGPNQLNCHYEKKGCFALDTCNFSYLYDVSVIRQVARVATHYIYGAIHYNSITSLLQQLFFNYYAIPLCLQS
jgi:hypothetical protein